MEEFLERARPQRRERRRRLDRRSRPDAPPSTSCSHIPSTAPPTRPRSWHATMNSDCARPIPGRGLVWTTTTVYAERSPSVSTFGRFRIGLRPVPEGALGDSERAGHLGHTLLRALHECHGLPSEFGTSSLDDPRRAPFVQGQTPKDQVSVKSWQLEGLLHVRLTMVVNDHAARSLSSRHGGEMKASS
jgi:hypothetical protein